MADGHSNRRHPSYKDMTGQQVGHWTVLREVGHTRSWVCRCICGIERSIPGIRLRRGGSFSCGCRSGEAKSAATRRHGHSRRNGLRTAEYRAWTNMIERCANPEATHYCRYGGRGISVCRQWSGAGGFDVFLLDVGCRPTHKHTLDRIDNSGNYEPGNVRWATRKEQSRNTSANRLLEHEGIVRTIAEWCEITGLPYHVLRWRAANNWPPEMIFSPVQHRVSNHS